LLPLMAGAAGSGGGGVIRAGYGLAPHGSRRDCLFRHTAFLGVHPFSIDSMVTRVLIA
jgi:hypothetical protein